MVNTKMKQEVMVLLDQYKKNGGIDMSYFDHIEWSQQAERVLRKQYMHIKELEAENNALRGE